MTDDELVFTRVFDAPRELVFQCMTQPEHLTHFWGPKGTSAPLDTVNVDMRPGGLFEVLMVNDSDGTTFQFTATYEEVVSPERLVWTDQNGIHTTSTFVALDERRTEVTIHQRNVPEFFRSAELQGGFESSLDKFGDHLATLATGR